MNNKKLEEENKKLKENLNSITQNQINENTKLELEKLKNDNEKLKSDLLKANKIISGIQNNEIKKLKDENEKLKYQLNIKEDEIKDLKLKIQNNIIHLPKYNLNEIMVVNFISQD